MKRISYNKLVFELDRLFFGSKLENQEQAEKQYDTIEVYLEAVGWTWDDILKEMCNEEVEELRSKFHN